ncbi:MAG TPA: hypothetical protein VFN28_10945 [Amaricoccus sp.]|nr:hypothetical protein [Amaricoccus sp.]
MTDPVAKLEIVTRDPLKVGERQSLSLRITTQGNEAVFVAVPLGDTAADLMSPEEFAACDIDFSERKPRGVLDIEPRPRDACFRVPISRIDALLAFEVSLANFLVEAHAGRVEITLHAGTLSSAPASTVSVVKRSTPAEIETFVATRYNVIQGGNVTLSWTLSQETAYDLHNAAAPHKALVAGRGTSGTSGTPPSLPRGNYVLRALAGDEVVDTRNLRIHAFGATGFKSYELNLPITPAATDILGFFAHPGRGRLYALLRPGTAERVELWSTRHGFDPDPDTWQPESNAQGETITLPLEAARRPGAIFQDRLWLIGGDCCDPDAPDSAIGYYDFQETAWHEVDDTDPRRWPDAMAERMGHAVVVLPSRNRLWVMGGWSQNGGTCGDIWEFDGKAWTPQKPTCDHCLFGATATADAVWRVGGFSDPGGQASLTVTRYGEDGSAVDINLPIAPGMQYCASALFVLDPAGAQPSGLATLHAASAYRHVLFFLGSERTPTIEVSDIEGTSAQGVLMPRDYYHIQPAVFQGAAFFRMLLPDRNARGSLLVSYLVKVDRNR